MNGWSFPQISCSPSWCDCLDWGRECWWVLKFMSLCEEPKIKKLVSTTTGSIYESREWFLLRWIFALMTNLKSRLIGWVDSKAAYKVLHISLHIGLRTCWSDWLLWFGGIGAWRCWIAYKIDEDEDEDDRNTILLRSSTWSRGGIDVLGRGVWVELISEVSREESGCFASWTRTSIGKVRY